MITSGLLKRLFDAAYMQRWNDQIRPVELTELDKQAHKWARDAMKASTWGRLSIAECWDKSMYQLLYSAAQQRLLKGGKLPHPHQDYCLEPEDHKYYKEHGQFTFADAGERCRYWGLSKAATAAIVDQKDAA